MNLADASKLLSIDTTLVRALGARFAALDLPGLHRQLPDVGKGLDVAARPLRLRHLRRIDSAAAHALRCFVFEDSLSDREARAAFGDVPIAPFVEGGLVSSDTSGNVTTRFQLRFSDDTYFFGDELKAGGDAVMSLGRMTIALTRAGWPDRGVDSVLDMGCGAGTSAILLAARARRVVATDINERAIVLTKLNIALNGVTKVEARQGDMYAPVESESFDLVISQPPFVPMPDGAATAVYRFGGRRGDELPLRALGELQERLRPGGRAVMFIKWPVSKGESITSRIRRALPQKDLNLLLIEAPGLSIDAECIGDLLFDHPDLGPEFARESVLMRDHLERLQIDEIRETITILQRTHGETGWNGVVTIPDIESAQITNDNVESMLAAHSLAARGADAIANARLRLPDGTRVARGKSKGALLVFSPDWFLAPMEVDEQTAAFVDAIHQSLTVRDASRRFVKPQGDSNVALPAFLEQVANALRAGVFVVARG